MPYYLDTSAFLKLFVNEAESPAMRAWFRAGRVCWSSQLLVTEVVRATRRLGLDLQSVEHALDAVSLVLPAATTFRNAASLFQPELRSLDALHLATALELGTDLEAVVTYDRRVAGGAHEAGVAVLTPA